MSRPKRNVHFSESYIEELQEFQNLDATIEELTKRYIDPDISAYIESQNCIAYEIVRMLCDVLKIKGKPDMERVEEEYEYYDSHLFKSGNVQVRTINRVKPEYRKDKDNGLP